MTDVVLCIDIGTTSLKAGLITAEGEVVATSSAKIICAEEEKSFIATKWMKAFFVAVKKICISLENSLGDSKEKSLGNSKEKLLRNSKESPLEEKIPYCIKAFSISGNGPTVVTENGRTELWNENYSVGLQLMNELCSSSGFTSHSLFMPKILSLKNKYPKDFEESKYIFSGPEFFIFQLTNNALTILPEARYVSAYWDFQLLSACSISEEKMPSWLSIGQKYGEVQKSIIKDLNDFIKEKSESGAPKTPSTTSSRDQGNNPFSKAKEFFKKEKSFLIFEEELPVFGAGPDFIAALIGTNTLTPGRICDRSGSSEGLNYCVPACVHSYGVRTLPSVIENLWNVSVLIPRSGKLSENKRLFAVKESIKVLRGIAAQYSFPFPEKLFVTGGQTKNSGYMKRKEKELGMSLSLANCDDAELLGDACVAYFAMGKYDSLQSAAKAIVKEKDFHEDL